MMARKDISDVQVLLAYLETKNPKSNIYGMHPYTILEKWTNEPHKVCYRAMERAEIRGYLNYGVSLRSGWVTEKGYELLKKM